MKNKVLYGWNLVRVLYLAIGLLIIIDAIYNREWWVLIPGGYIAAMGLFALGCAGGACNAGIENNTITTHNKIKTK